MRWQTYSGVIYGWLVENRAPHTDWAAPREKPQEVLDAAAASRAGRPVDLAAPDIHARNAR
jgi:hypothetical protein